MTWLVLAALSSADAQDRGVYDDVLAAGWQDWSWSGTYDFSASAPVHNGAASISAVTGAWGGLSLYTPTPFDGMGALSLWFDGPATVDLVVASTLDGISAPALPVDGLGAVAPGTWTELVLDLSTLGVGRWDRLSLVDTSGSGSTFAVDDIVLLETAPSSSVFTDAEPLATSQVVLHGGGDPALVTVTVGGAPRSILATELHAAPQRAYLTLDGPVGPGTLQVVTADGTFVRTFATAATTAGASPTHAISPHVYGVAFPDPVWAADHGVRAARWGGNAVSLYNPFLGVTSAGVDWYFENRPSQDAGAWIDGLRAQGLATFLTVPALDWVAGDASSSSYSVARYGAQQDVDPFNPDAGNGVLLDGTPITWNDPNDACVPWTPTDARTWLEGLANEPVFLSVDNELDITSDTHRDVHPAPLGYDELLSRYLAWSGAIDTALPDALVAAPSSCCWWYYWNSAVGASDKAAHGGVDFVPWFLQQVAAADATAGRRSLDVLDIHYYPDGVFNDVVDPATRARRLRSTRSLWDPTYTDEGWIGTDLWATATQPNRNQVQLIPRFQSLIAAEYPGTMLGLTEWNWGAEADLSGGLAVADVLGILGQHDIDLATYWTTPDAGTPAAAAFWLFGAPSRPFGRYALPVAQPDPDLIGVYAALDDAGRHSVVVVNKDPASDLWLDLGGLPGGTWTTRHFGGAAQGARLVGPAVQVTGPLAVPAYGAVFLSREVPAWPLVLSHAPLVAGGAVDLVVTGAAAGETVHFVGGTAGGSGPCPPALGGLCLDIVDNLTLLGSATADGAGEARLAAVTPWVLARRDGAVQAVAIRGAGGSASVASNPKVTEVVP